MGAVAGTLVGLANGILKPVAGTLLSLTWFCRGIYANVSNEALADKGVEVSIVNTLGFNVNEEQIQHFNNNIDQAAKAASTVSGFSPEVCRQIITEFDDIKKQNVDYHSRRHKSR